MVFTEFQGGIPNGYRVYPGMIVPDLYVGVYNKRTGLSGIVSRDFVREEYDQRLVYDHERMTFSRA